ncbi:MAG: YqhA family protein [Nitrospirae bacterium]|nr:YqhA family protein [Nitrospirota bacterium]
MDRFFEKSKYLIFIAVVSALLASMFAFLLGVVKTGFVFVELIITYGKDPIIAVHLVEIMDVFLIAIALFMFSVGTYELFISDIELPEWLVIRNLHDFMVKLGSVIILVMVVTFLKHLVEWRDPQGTFYFGIAVAVVSASLIAFSHFKSKD